MQYQVLDKEGNLIAWIDTNETEQIIDDDYILQVGNNLSIVETEDGIKGKIRSVIRLG